MHIRPLPGLVSPLDAALAQLHRHPVPAETTQRGCRWAWLPRRPAIAKAGPRLLLFFILCLAVPAGLRAQIVDLATFNGANGRFPEDGLVLSGNTLYGTTNYGGANGTGEIFSVPLTGGTPTVLGSFNGANGENPEGGLLVSAGTLFGVTPSGGANNDGAVFSLPVGGGTPTLLSSFNGTNGKTPEAALILSQDGSTFYGSTYQGGANGNYGTIFSLPVAGGTPTVLTSFNLSNGASPNGPLTLIGSSLYGVAQNGGASGSGVVFSLPVAGGTPTILATFNGTNGQNPSGGLTLIGSTLYGATAFGGAYGNGEIFSLPVGGGTPTILASFNGTNGSGAEGSLVLSPDGNTFYGVTVRGGANNAGVIFSVPVAGGTPRTIASFNEADGDEPVGSLVENGDSFYGVTNGGGSSGDGVIFTAPEPGGATLLLLGAMAAISRRPRQRSGGRRLMQKR